MAAHIPQDTGKPLNVSIPLPRSPDTIIHISVTILATSYLIFLTSSTSTELSMQSQAQTSFLTDQSLADTSQLQEVHSQIPPRIAPIANSTLGSFIYGLPNRFSPTEPLTTALVSVPTSLDLATRLCRILVRKLANLQRGAKPVNLGCSITFDGFGDRVEEEISVTQTVVEAVVRLVQGHNESSKVNGIKD